MNNMQRILFVIYLPITFLILIFDHIYPIEDMVQYLKYTIMITLFLSSIIIKKKFYVQKIMALSISLFPRVLHSYSLFEFLNRGLFCYIKKEPFQEFFSTLSLLI